MTPDVVDAEDGVVRYRLDDAEEVEALAAALEETARRVRAWPPYVHGLHLHTDDVVVEEGLELAAAMLVERRPVCRVFDLRWPS